MPRNHTDHGRAAGNEQETAVGQREEDGMMRHVAEHTEMNHAGWGVLFLLGGVVMGAAVGLLTAPRSGERTRRHFVRAAEDVKDQAAEVCDDMTERIEDLRRGAAQKFEAGKKYLNAKRPGLLNRPSGLTNPLYRLINALRG
jgi:hypothetical protein